LSLARRSPATSGLKRTKQTKISCPLCGSHRLQIFYSVNDVPASCNRLWTNKDDAQNCPKGDIRLAFCPRCTFISNIAIEPQKNRYDNQYDNSLFYSAYFQKFAKKLAAELVQRYSLYDKRIVEIGGGKVDFLSLILSIGDNNGFRLNPFDVGQENAGTAEGFGKSRLGPLQSLEGTERIDFIFSYHELEHMNDPKTFLSDLRLAVAQNLSVRLFFAVPNVLKAFEDGDYTDVVYEHVSYFTQPSLCFLFSNCRFNILNLEETEGEVFDSIYVDANIKQEGASQIKLVSHTAVMQVEKSVEQFTARANENIRGLTEEVKKLLDKGNRVVVWGVGARGVTILNILKETRIEYAVDINPRKQGLYVPGTGQTIVKPEFLSDYKPDYVLISNAPYEEEIKKILGSLKVDAGFLHVQH
jgi:hypothetical protein